MKTRIDHAGPYPVEQVTYHPASALVDLDAPRAGVLHTTEGGWAGSESVLLHRHFAPHFMLGLDKGKIHIVQFVPIGHIGTACRAHNNKAIVQIEMIGFAKEELWRPDEETSKALAALMVVCRDEWGIPLSRPWKDGDYGRAGDNPHRHAGKFGEVAGWYGHADMLQPDAHWDPGNLEWSYIFGLANNTAPIGALPEA